MADRPRRLYLPLVGLLAFTSGGVDVMTLMRLGGAFTSVITGNLVFAGRGIGTVTLYPAMYAALAVAGYIAGVAAASRLRQALDRRTTPKTPDGTRPKTAAWPRSATGVLLAEWVVLAAVAVAWIGWNARPPAAAVDVLLIAAAGALGMQGAAARGISGNPSTTYMTGALTALVEALATGRRDAADAAAAAGLLMLAAGAACGAVLVEHASVAALLPPLAALLLVVVIKLRHHRGEDTV